MSIAGWTTPPIGARTSAPRVRGWRLPVAAARLPAFLLLAGFGGVTWSRMVEPIAANAMLGMLGACAAGAGLLMALARRQPAAPIRIALTLVVLAALMVVALAVAGVPGDLARPRAWDDLAAGLSQGLSVVPNVRVPYHGVEEWTRIVIVFGGGGLVALAVVLAFAPRRNGALGLPIAAALVLGTLYLVPVMQRNGEHQYLGGATFAVLLGLFLWLERIELRAAPLAAGVVVTAVLAALVVAPRIDGEMPLLNYETLAQSLTPVVTHYSWEHGYGPLTWPRDGSEVLRVRAADRAYWKATNLSFFDGTRWVEGPDAPGPAVDAGLDALHPDWRQRLFVTVRGLRSSQFIGAGTTIAIADAPRELVRNGPGAFSARDKPLRRGNAYRALVYSPRPTARELRAAALLALPDRPELTSIALPETGQLDPRVLVKIPAWGQGEPSQDVVDALRSSEYARAYDLARRLRAGAATPYAFVLAVERHLGEGFTYSERPRAGTSPLMEFLFGEHRGYCQQFSGSMALLLRLGGVPARVAAGFSPGVFDHARDEYVVRDYDAHSWVEVFFPGVGWVTRDPTPADSPARSQIDERRLAAGLTAGAESDSSQGSVAPRADTTSAGGGVSTERGGSELPVIALASIVVLALLAGLLVLRRSRRRRRGGADGPEDDIAESSLAELRRALRRSGRPPSPATTLDALAQRWNGTAAEGYLRALAAARYGYGDGGPSPAQRAALRRELACGRGITRWPRAWWALPPRMPRRAHHRSTRTWAR